VSYGLVPIRRPERSRRLDLDSFARDAGVHPELIRRLVVLGLLEPQRDSAGVLSFTRYQLRDVSRIQRLRAGLGLNYMALGLVIDLLDRIADLERQLRTTPTRPAGGRLWT
jgi:DNA-binding transcriptional MerR regulator